jgi:hypothetical protein
MSVRMAVLCIISVAGLHVCNSNGMNLYSTAKEREAARTGRKSKSGTREAGFSCELCLRDGRVPASHPILSKIAALFILFPINFFVFPILRRLRMGCCRSAYWICFCRSMYATISFTPPVVGSLDVRSLSGHVRAPMPLAVFVHSLVISRYRYSDSG